MSAAASTSSSQPGTPATEQQSLILDSLRQLSAETWAFTSVPVDVVHAPVDPCAFLRQHVAANTPLLIRGAIDHWPAAQCWSKEYLDAAVGSTEVSVELTPNGFGDAVTAYEAEGGQPAECFCMPHSSRMPFQQFTDTFFCSKQQQQGIGASDGVAAHIPYLSVGVLFPFKGRR